LRESLLRLGQPEPQVAFTLGGRGYVATRARLGNFLHMQQAREEMSSAAQNGDTGAIADSLFLWLSAAAGAGRAEFEQATWIEIGVAFANLSDINRMDQLPIIRYPSGNLKPVKWDFRGREVMAWIDAIAHAYGWSLDEILALYPEEALGLLQEISAREYHERRFQHALSEVAYEVRRDGKSVYHQLDPPYWMAVGEPHKTKIPRKVLPLGNIVFPKNAPEELVH